MNVNEGVGQVDGLEFIARRARVDHFFGWVSYTLSRSVRQDHPLQDDTWTLFDFDQTHILTVVAGYGLPHDFEISGRLQYVTGNPYTPYAGAITDLDTDSWIGYQDGDWNSLRTPPYSSLDLRVDKLFTYKHWQLELFMDLLNVVHGTNPEGIRYNYDYTESTWIGGLPFIPSPGVQAEIHL